MQIIDRLKYDGPENVLMWKHASRPEEDSCPCE